MTPDQIAELARFAEQRGALEAERRRIDKAYCLAVLDHISAKIRAACPEAVYVTYAYYGSRTLDLHGVLGAQTSPVGTCPELWSNLEGEGGAEHPLDAIADAIESDVQTALAPYSSPAWASVHRNSASEGNSWLLELPPADRAARVAELVREHHPDATAVVVDARSAGGRIIEILAGEADDGTAVRTPPGWLADCDTVLTRLLSQMFALPALADRHLMPLPRDYVHPYGISPSSQIRLMPLPPTA
ncbi:hypothetical protein [Streptomyces sp. R35]|uniref:Uncharacterized protein n=1 Tax=Streptomyces sp. R35 TaxID=3238630 RepID=A0AB39S7K7_9ACTN